ncbi:lipopolysaccharide biosynthesis protein [Bacteroides congonensis]|uniref:lipopolysaccharide biosynthesis protein n=1 Tax=Bacteroides congonensis TaxID=1871006 RepID=UPI0026751660|nr:lipopolysaccharide biosynthesis protein [Bacteroides congonensis]
MGSVRQETLSGVKWTAIENFSIQGIQFFLGLVMARLLSPSDYGVLGMIGIFIAISQTFINCGFTSALIRKIDRTQEDCSTVFYFNIIAALFFYLLLFFTAPYISYFFETPVLRVVIRVIAINLVIDSLAAVHRTQLTIKIDFRSQAIISFITCILSGAVGVYLAYKGYGVWALVYQQVAGAILNVILTWYVSKWIPSFIFSKSSFCELFAFGSKLLGANLLHTFYSNVTTIAIGKFYSAKELGFYTRGNNFASLPSSNLVGILQRVTFPILSKIQNDEERLLGVYDKYIRITSLPVFFLMCLLVSVSKPLILILITDKWYDSVIYLQILCFAMMFDHITTVNMNLLQVRGRSDLVLKTEIIKKSISFAMIIASIPLGVMAICISRVVYTQIAIFLSTYYTGKEYGLSYKSQFKSFFPYFFYGIIAMLPSLLLCTTDLSPYITLPTGIIVNTAIYYFLIRKDSIWLELKELLLSKLK